MRLQIRKIWWECVIMSCFSSSWWSLPYNLLLPSRYAVVVDMIASKSNIGEVRIEGFSVEAFKVFLGAFT